MWISTDCHVNQHRLPVYLSVLIACMWINTVGQCVVKNRLPICDSAQIASCGSTQISNM